MSAGLKQITTDDIATYREVRLRALQDTPLAFGSTYAREVLLTDVEWLKRAEALDGVARIGFLALEDERACGLVLCFFDQPETNRAEVISMWVAPEQRGTELSQRLLDAIHTWAIDRGAKELQLLVTSSNDRAVKFYERYGFAKTGRTEPYPNDPALFEFEMILPLC